MLARPFIGGQIDDLLDALWQAGGTDLLLTAGQAPQIRVHGELGPVWGYPMLTPTDTETLLSELVISTEADSWALSRERDFAFSWRDKARVRGNAFIQQGKTAIALRMVPREVPSMDQLGLPSVMSDFARQHQGLVLVTGPTGSGKSTTLAALVNQINTDRACHILTIEDPIEYVHDHKRATVNQREVGSDTGSFADALRGALRADPDVVLVGEMRDLDSIRFALSIAETGHLVLASLHTNDTSQALARIIDVFPAEQQSQVRTQLAAALTGIVYQRLIPRIGGGLVAAYEALVATPAVRNLIKEGKTHQLRNSLVTGQRDGMLTFEQSLSALVQARVITHEDALARSLYPKEVEAAAPMMVGVPA
jgi:twitching motility protein PilT